MKKLKYYKLAIILTIIEYLIGYFVTLDLDIWHWQFLCPSTETGRTMILITIAFNLSLNWIFE